MDPDELGGDGDPGWTGADEAMVKAAKTGDGLVVVSPEQLRTIALEARKVYVEFREHPLVVGMSRVQAEYVRVLRVEREYTWRAVALTCALEWGGDWESNQLAGMAICERAAGMFGENHMTGVWN